MKHGTISGVKIKDGFSVERVLRRLAAVPKAIGPGMILAIDGNGKWELPTYLSFARATVEHDVCCFEEPMLYEDVQGQAQLARPARIPLAPGAQFYSLEAFGKFFT